MLGSAVEGLGLQLVVIATTFVVTQNEVLDAQVMVEAAH